MNLEIISVFFGNTIKFMLILGIPKKTIPRLMHYHRTAIFRGEIIEGLKEIDRTNDTAYKHWK
jgi:hypothetical protein